MGKVSANPRRKQKPVLSSKLCRASRLNGSKGTSLPCRTDPTRVRFRLLCQVLATVATLGRVPGNPAKLTRLSQLDPDLGNFADGLNGNWLIGLARSRKNSGKAAAVPTKELAGASGAAETS